MTFDFQKMGMVLSFGQNQELPSLERSSMSQFIVAPLRSNEEALTFLYNLSHNDSHRAEQHKDPITKSIIDNLVALYEPFRDDYRAYARQSAALKIKKKYHNQFRKEFIQIIRDFWAVLGRFHRRKKYPATLKGNYYRNHHKGIPKSCDLDTWQSIAKGFIDGDRSVEEWGYLPMSNPSREEIQEIMDLLKKYEYYWDQSDLGRQKKALERQLRNIQLQHSNLAKCFRNNQWDMTPSTRRDLMRLYGFKFINRSKKARTEVLDDFPEIEEVIPMEEMEPLMLETPSIMDEIEAELDLTIEALEKEMAPAEVTLPEPQELDT